MIAQQGETQHTTIITPTTCEDLQRAANCPIEIQRRIDYPFLFISASDGYKKADVKDRLHINQPESKKNIVFALGGVGFYGLPFYSAGAGYMRRIYGPVVIGGSAAIMPGGFGVNILAGVMF